MHAVMNKPYNNRQQ